jgi:hypothetical protein
MKEEQLNFGIMSSNTNCLRLMSVSTDHTSTNHCFITTVDLVCQLNLLMTSSLLHSNNEARRKRHLKRFLILKTCLEHGVAIGTLDLLNPSCWRGAMLHPGNLDRRAGFANFNRKKGFVKAAAEISKIGLE